VADLLLNRTVLFINRKRFKITEVEFFVNDSDVHFDTYAKGDLIERTKGKWCLRSDAAAGKLEVSIGGALKDNVCGVVRIISIMPLKDFVKVEIKEENKE
jgi:hypothetical protein